MFKPDTFRFASTIHWPGAGPTNEIASAHIADVKDEGDAYTFVHASGHAVKVPKANVTALGVWDEDTIPNLPTKDKKDGHKKSHRSAANRSPVAGPDASAEIVPSEDGPKETDKGDTDDGSAGDDKAADSSGDKGTDVDDSSGSSELAQEMSDPLTNLFQSKSKKKRK